MNQIKRNIFSFWQRFIFEMTFVLGRDPWNYTSLYQQTKYEQTIKLLPSIPIKQALELGCAEGYLTGSLATRVDHLIAADISQIALDRAAKNCTVQRLENVCYLRLDLTTDLLPMGCDLIVCSEVLYYIGGQTELQTVARKLVNALAPGGYLLTAHAHRVNKEPERTHFDWLLPFGAKLISETLTDTHSLRLVKDIQTSSYCIQLFQLDCSAAMSLSHSLPEMIELPPSALPLPDHNFFDPFSLAFIYNKLQQWLK